MQEGTGHLPDNQFGGIVKDITGMVPGNAYLIKEETTNYWVPTFQYVHLLGKHYFNDLLAEDGDDASFEVDTTDLTEMINKGQIARDNINSKSVG